MVGLKMNKNIGTGLVLVLGLLSQVQAHIALWDEAMYGWNNDVNQYDPVLPLDHLSLDQWWFHGYANQPPAEGKMMLLPAGGTYHGQVACNKAWTKYGVDITMTSAEYACDDDKANSGTGAMHTTDRMGSTNPTDVKGCGLSIAYESDVTKLKPEDFTVVSINYECPWKKDVDFHIPADLPPCPEGGCHCSWGWIHSVDGGSAQMYQLGYRCDVTGATMKRALPKPQVSRKCDYPNDVSNCTVGAKQPHYWYQNEGNNNFQGQYDPPYYNHEMGFMNGAQTDLFAGLPEETTPEPSSSESALPSSSAHAGISIGVSIGLNPTEASTSASAISTQDAASSEASPSASAVSTQDAASSEASPSASLSSLSTTSTITSSHTSSSVAVSSSEMASSSVIESSASSASIPATISAVASGTTAFVPMESAATTGRCRRKRRRSLDEQRLRARTGRLGNRNRTVRVRHVTALAQ